jgi:hypothetical protein
MVLLVNGNLLDMVVLLSDPRLCNSLCYERECLKNLEFWKAVLLVRSYSGPDVKIWGEGGEAELIKRQAPTEMAGGGVKIIKIIILVKISAFDDANVCC